MSRAGIVIDAYKLPVFKALLDNNGFTYTEHPGFSPETLILKVDTDNVQLLSKVVRRANHLSEKGTLQ